MHGFVSLRVDQRVALALAGHEARLVQGIGKRGPLDVLLTPKATELLRRREMSRCVKGFG
jgi:hypothetical protein